MNIAIFQPMKLADDLSEGLKKSYQEIAGELVRITTSQRDIDRQRDTIKALEPLEITAAEIDRMRHLSHDLAEAFREELALRTGAYTKWFTAFHREIREALLPALKVKAEGVQAEIIQRMRDIGFDDQGATASVAKAHPETREIVERLKRIEDLGHVLGNDDRASMAYPPRLNNSQRIAQLQELLKDALKRAHSPLADAAFV